MISLYSRIKTNELLDFAIKLIESQNKKGSWHNLYPNLQSVILTCQSALYLCNFKGQIFENSLSKAISWLKDIDVSNSKLEYGTWRLLPLIKARADQKVILATKKEIETNIEKGLIHDLQKSPLREFYIECALEMGITNDQTIIKHVKELFNNLSCCPEDFSAERLAYCLAVLLEFNNINRDIIDQASLTVLASKVLKIIRTKAIKKNDFMYCWATIVSTAYITRSLLKIQKYCTISEDKTVIENLKNGAENFLIKIWENKEFISEPLAGGELKNTNYTKIIVARTLIDIANQNSHTWIENCWADRYYKLKTKLDFLLYLVSGFLLIIIGLSIDKVISFRDAFKESILIWTWIGRISNILGIITIVIPFIKKLLKQLK